jgi:integrase/recombinase XerC
MNEAMIAYNQKLLSSKVAINDLVNSFLSGRKKTTIKAYHQDLTYFADYLNAEDLNQAASILVLKEPGAANKLVLDYKTYMLDQSFTPATVNRRLASLRSLVKLAKTLGMVTWDLMVENVKSKPYRNTLGPGLFGYRSILEAAKDRHDIKGIRDVAILRLLYDRALRRGEVAALNVCDVDLKHGKLNVLGKGKNEIEILSIPPAVTHAISNWLEIRGNEAGPLFTNLDRAKKGDGRLTGTAIYYIVREYSKNLDTPTRPHGLRHTSITEALRLTNGNYQMTQSFSRHADVRTIKFYDDNMKDLGGKVATMVSAVV